MNKKRLTIIITILTVIGISAYPIYEEYQYYKLPNCYKTLTLERHIMKGSVTYTTYKPVIVEIEYIYTSTTTLPANIIILRWRPTFGSAGGMGLSFKTPDYNYSTTVYSTRTIIWGTETVIEWVNKTGIVYGVKTVWEEEPSPIPPITPEPMGDWRFEPEWKWEVVTTHTLSGNGFGSGRVTK